MLEPSRIDWRAYLWRYLVQTPTDFQGFNRRFIGRGLYLDALTGESVQIYLAVDTSGLIDEPAMQRHQPFETAICIYLTDGYGQFPLAPPPLPVLWVITAGGLALEQFPFGETVRLLATSPSRGIL